MTARVWTSGKEPAARPNRAIQDEKDDHALTLTYAGLNTVLDSLAALVPLIAMPITYERPAIAARLVASGAGLSIAPAWLTAARITEGILPILRDTSYRDRVQSVADEICAAGGAERAS
jgi:zeaxanthin glucosyltransferase